MTRVLVYLDDQELQALRQQAECELRGLREQARLLIRKGLRVDRPVLDEHCENKRDPQEAQYDYAAA